MTASNRYIQAAIAKWGGDANISIDTDDASVDNSPNNGAWVSALLWVSDVELEPEPGPTYLVWSCSLNPEGTAFGPWMCNGTFTCNEVDGRQARANAHEYARSLRRQYPAALVAVRPAAGRPLTPRFNG